MISFSVNDAAMAVNGKVTGNGEAMVTMVAMDSRLIVPGGLFVAIRGERVDGHDFAADVLAKGAAAVLCDHIPENVPGTYILVENTVKALQQLAEWYRHKLDITLVGITGSVGKTSTKEIVASVLAEKFPILKTPGNYNNEIGLPLTVLSVDEDIRVVVLEMGISDFGEMRLLSRIARPDVCVITNIGQSHLENLGTRDGILKTKTEIFEFRNPVGPVFLNGDDDKLITIKDVDGVKPVFFGNEGINYAHPENVKSLGFKGTEFKLFLGARSLDVSISVVGRHNVANACVAAAIGEYLGMTDEEIKMGLKNAGTIDGRSNLIPFGEGFIIDDCYNAAPISMKAAIDMLCLAEGRKVAILGDMFELGKDEEAMHAEIGEYAVSKPVDVVIAVGELSRNMYEAALKHKGDKELYRFDNKDELLEKISGIVRKGDNILVKASNGMKFKEIVKYLKDLA